MSTPSERHVMLLGHGTISDEADIAPFLTNIRRGRPSPPELIEEITRRFRAIGGSPLLRISRELAAAVEAELGRPVHVAMRFWHPFAKDVLRDVAASGCRELTVVPLAPYSGSLYAAEVKRLGEQLASEGVSVPRLLCAPSWGTERQLIDAFALALAQTLAELPPERRAAARVLFTAHSLPLAVIRQGDTYAAEVEATARAVASVATPAAAVRVVYQSQGATSDPWLGPDVHASLREAAADGARDVVLCPIGFLSDHVEVLYDLDIEAKQWADALGLTLVRTRSLNTAPGLVGALAAVASRAAG
jgi:ferrochelatase